MPIGSPGRMQQRGLTFLWALLLLFAITLGLGKLLEVQSTYHQRFLEDELLWTGEQYRRAIEHYYQASPGTDKKLPEKIEDLLLDPRLLTMTRHLREAYLDPITNQPFSEIRNYQGRLIGVRSTSPYRPIKQAGFSARHAHFSSASSYQQWEFVYLP